MKKTWFFLLAFGLPLLSLAQPDTIVSEKRGNAEVVIEKEEEDRKVTVVIGDDDDDEDDDDECFECKERTVKTRWLMLDYGISTYMHEGSLDLPAEYEGFEQRYWGSNNWNLHVFQQRVNLHQRKLNLLYGLTFEFSRYRFENDISLQADQAQVTLLAEPGQNFEKNRLNTTYLTVPLMLNVETNPGHSNSFRFSAGGYAGVRLSARLRQEGDMRGDTNIDDDFNLNRFRYGLTGRIGYGPINFYTYYSLTDLFDKDENGGFALQPISFGIAILPF